MRSILEEFACGNISPESRYFKNDSRFGRAMQKLTDSEDKLLAALNEEEKELLESLIDAQSEISFLSAIDKFIYGYRLGVLMTTEVFEGKDDLTTSVEIR